MEELGVESGFGPVNDIAASVVSDCTIETDQTALIPDSYIDMTAEKIRLYKELDSIKDEKVLDTMKSRLEDRFGKIPDELDRLFDIVRIRNLAGNLGFEKVIIKNGVMIAFFISNPMSQYYRSKKFAGILESINENNAIFELKQSDDRLRIFSRNIPDLKKAYSALCRLNRKN